MSFKTLFGIGISCLSLTGLGMMIPLRARSLSASVPPDVRVSVVAANHAGKLLRIEITATNIGTVPVYIMADPQRSDRSLGWYIEANPETPSLIVCTAQLYPLPPFDMYFNATHVHLLLLKPGQSHMEKFALPLPIRTTEPPFSSSPGTRQLAAPPTRIGAAIGVLTQTDELDRLLALKVGHESITGPEQVGGRPLLQLQQVVRAASVEVSAQQ
jgi:hypothetical protein